MTLHESKEEERLPLLKYANPQVADNRSGYLFMRKLKALFLPTDKITCFLLLISCFQINANLLKYNERKKFHEYVYTVPNRTCIGRGVQGKATGQRRQVQQLCELAPKVCEVTDGVASRRQDQ